MALCHFSHCQVVHVFRVLPFMLSSSGCLIYEVSVAEIFFFVKYLF